MSYKYLTGELLSDFEALGSGISGYGDAVSKLGQDIQNMNVQYANTAVETLNAFKGQTRDGIMSSFTSVVEGLNGVTEGMNLLSEMVSGVLQYFAMLQQIKKNDENYYVTQGAYKEYKDNEDDAERKYKENSDKMNSTPPDDPAYATAKSNRDMYADKLKKYNRLREDAKAKMDEIDKNTIELVTKAKTLRGEIVTKDTGFVYSPKANAPTNTTGGISGYANEWLTGARNNINTAVGAYNGAINYVESNSWLEDKVRNLFPIYDIVNPDEGSLARKFYDWVGIGKDDAGVVATSTPTTVVAATSFTAVPLSFTAAEYDIIKASVDTTPGALQVTINTSDKVSGSTSPFKRYAQGDYKYSYNGGTVASEGCGVCATASVLSGYEDVSMKSLTAEMDKYSNKQTLSQVTDVLSNHGLKVSDPITVNKANASEVAATLKEHLANGGQAVVLVGKSSTAKNSTKYTKGGHFMTVVGTEDDGSLIIRNSSGTSSTGTVDELVNDYMANYVAHSNGKDRPPRGMVLVYGKE